MFNYLKYLAILFIFPLSFAYSEILEPKKNISPKEVVKIQLAGLKKNDLS